MIEKLGETKVRGRGDTITMPKSVREAVGGLNNGDYIVFYRKGNNICIAKAKLEVKYD